MPKRHTIRRIKPKIKSKSKSKSRSRSRSLRIAAPRDFPDPAEAHAQGVALVTACEEQDTDTALDIIEKNVKQEVLADLNVTNDKGDTPLLIASWEGLTDIVKALLDSKQVAINATNNEGATALIQACTNGYVEVALALLAEPGIDVNAVDKFGTALKEVDRIIKMYNNGHRNGPAKDAPMRVVRAKLLQLGATKEKI